MYFLRLVALLPVIAGCNGSTGEEDDANTERVPDPGDIDLDAECPSRLEPEEPFGQIEVVGDGTAASCTEAAVRSALETIRATDGGGSISFDCGEALVITLTEPLFVDTALLVDGEDTITLSGGGTTRVLELDHYAELTLQRLTIADGLTEESGAAVYHPWYGTLRAIDVSFENNRCTRDRRWRGVRRWPQ